MSRIKSIFSWLSIYLVSGVVFLAVGVWAIHIVMSPDNIKSTLKEQRVYDNLVSAILKTSSTQAQVEAGVLPVSEPWVQEAAKRSFPPSDLELKSNTLVDGIFGWLKGDTSKPQVDLDFSQNKQQFATELSTNVKNRAASLPTCSLQNIPTSIDPYRITCIPPGVSSDAVATSVANDIANNQDFLKNTTVSWQDIQSSQIGKQADSSTVKSLHALRNTYKSVSTLIWLLPLLAIGLSALGVLLAVNRQRAVNRLAHTYTYATLGLLIFAVFITLITHNFTQMAAQNALSTEVLVPVFTSLFNQMRSIYFVSAGVTAVIAASLVIAEKRLLHK